MSELIEQAVSILRRGGIVAFPTETVYGLGADATNAAAVRRVFEIKGRPATNPVIVHVADEEIAKRYASVWPVAATRLAEEFWPGPLTLVVPRAPSISDAVTAGRDSVGLRAPDHPLTLELLRAFDGAIIGPSANRSTRVSPTTADHVREELGDAVDLILDGGACRVGIESTVLDLTTSPPTILRPGAVSREQIEQAIGPVALPTLVTDMTVAASGPGQHAVHYSPHAPTFRFEPQQIDRIDAWRAANPNKFAIVLCITAALDATLTTIPMPTQADEYARKMYAALRDADRQSPGSIWIEIPPDAPEWTAVRDRLTRASRPAV